jgi:hypothetical protein
LENNNIKIELPSKPTFKDEVKPQLFEGSSNKAIIDSKK